jgi:Domain of unknown function (DUF4082)
VAVYSLFTHTGTPAISGTPSGNVTLGTEFSLSKAAALTGIWFYSPSGATHLPGNCAIYKVAGQAQVAGTLVNNPTWSGAAASGWVKCSYAGTVTLAAATNYRVCVFCSSQTAWAYQGSYWTGGGPGAGGRTSGIITAPPAATAADSGAQVGISSTASLAYPASAADAPSNAWIDVEVTIGGAGAGAAVAALAATGML